MISTVTRPSAAKPACISIPSSATIQGGSLNSSVSRVVQHSSSVNFISLKRKVRIFFMFLKYSSSILAPSFFNLKACCFL
jgi:hypothetical protein